MSAASMAAMKRDTEELELRSTVITADEKAVYDRQIRLWGLDAQNRLRKSSVLVAGLSGCGAEVVKNLMLAGLKRMTLLDDREVTEADESCQFLIPLGSVGKNRAEASRARCQALNPNVELVIDTGKVEEKESDYFTHFDLVIIIDQKYSVVEKIDDICRKAHVGFEAGGVYGWVGYAFFDFNDHLFLLDMRKKDLATLEDDDETVVVDSRKEENGVPPSKRTRLDAGASHNGVQHPVNVEIADDERTKMSVAFSSWSEALNVDWSLKRMIRKARRILPESYTPIRALLRASDDGVASLNAEKFTEMWKAELSACNQNPENARIDDFSFFIGPQLSPVCAIVGAMIGQEAIKALSETEPPLKNLFLYSALDATGFICNLPPPL